MNKPIHFNYHERTYFQIDFLKSKLKDWIEQKWGLTYAQSQVR